MDTIGRQFADLTTTTPAEWARLMAFHAGRLDLTGAIRVIRAAPIEISGCLSEALRDACPALLEPANDLTA